MSFEEITFKADKKHRDKYFSAGSFAHPAKMMLPLQRWLIERYSKSGDVILDPMAGQGTLLIACTTGRHVIMVELESKFVQMQRDNWTKIQTLGPEMGYEMGTATILQGDARKLPDVLADVVITSPPYESSPIGGGLNTKPPREGHNDQSGRNPKTPSQLGAGKYDKPLPDVMADVVITSPPYAETMASGGSAVHPLITGKGTTRGRGYSSFGDLAFKEYAPSPDNIGNLPYGKLADVIMASPPYGIPATSQESSRDEIERRIRKGIKGAVITEKGECMTGDGKRQQRYSEDPENIGNLPYGNIDCVITSPPYEGSLEKPLQDGQSRGARGREQSKRIETDSKTYWQGGISDNQGNIGNLKGESYLSAMLEVYQGCWRVLKPQGLMCLVTKNFIRNKQEIRLDLDTIKLCNQAGFELIERHYRRLTSQSFWRTIALQKCDHRHGSKDNPKCKLGLQCPFQPEAVKQLRLLPAKEKRMLRVEKLCPSYINSSPELKCEDILVFKKLWS